MKKIRRPTALNPPPAVTGRTLSGVTAQVIPGSVSIASRPTVTINAAGSDPTASTVIPFTVVFSEAVTGFTGSDVTIGGTAGATTASVTGTGANYTVNVSGMATDGTVTASIPAGIAQNAGGSFNFASTSTDNQVTWSSAGAGGRAVLQPSDVTYLGMFKIPNGGEQGTRFGYSTGALAGRRVGGQIRLFITGADINASPIAEINYPGYGATFATAPRASLIRNWAWAPYTNLTTGGSLQPASNNYGRVEGLHWYNDQLYWAFGDNYNTGGLHDPSVGTAILNDTNGTAQAYGPWRTQTHSQRTRGYMVTIPDWFRGYVGGKPMGIGGHITSGNAPSPWGAYLTAFDPPVNSTTADVAQTTTGGEHITIVDQTVIYHGIDHKQARDTNYKHCALNVISDWTQGGVYLNDETPEWTSLDMASCAAWVDTGTKTGMVYFGQLIKTVPGYPYSFDTVTHWWYGNSTCGHGQASTLSQSQGDAAGSSVSYMWIFDPYQMQLSAQGAINPWIEPASETALYTFAGSGIGQTTPTIYRWGGAYWDATAQLLFVSEALAENVANELQPIIHVFQVS